MLSPTGKQVWYLKESDLASNVLVYPNPAQNKLNLIVKNYSNQSDFKVKVFDVLGKNVDYHLLSNTSTDFSIDISTLDNGIYFLEVYDGKEIIGRNRVIKGN